MLTIAGPAATSMPNTARIQASQGNMVGAHVREAAGNRLVLFSGDSGAEPPAGNIVYSFQPTADTLHRLLNLQPGKAYQIAVQTAGGSQTVRARPGGEFHASPQGVLSFTTTADGHVPRLGRGVLPQPQGTYLPLVMR